MFPRKVRAAKVYNEQIEFKYINIQEKYRNHLEKNYLFNDKCSEDIRQVYRMALEIASFNYPVLSKD